MDYRYSLVTRFPCRLSLLTTRMAHTACHTYALWPATQLNAHRYYPYIATTPVLTKRWREFAMRTLNDCCKLLATVSGAGLWGGDNLRHSYIQWWFPSCFSLTWTRESPCFYATPNFHSFVQKCNCMLCLEIAHLFEMICDQNIKCDLLRWLRSVNASVAS